MKITDKQEYFQSVKKFRKNASSSFQLMNKGMNFLSIERCQWDDKIFKMAVILEYFSGWYPGFHTFSVLTKF